LNTIRRAKRGIDLMTPMHGRASCLIGMRGDKVLYEWQFPLQAGMYGQMLPGGNNLWAGRTKDGPSTRRACAPQPGLTRQRKRH
jgi:hypothetical protein